DDRGGCEPVLPEDTCPRGQMAIPGDLRCRDVAPCGDGEYGAIPVEANTEFVNAAYPGVDSDGTRARPWKRIQQGIDHAPPGGIVAVAAGVYTEDLLIRSRPVRLWGRCPALVEVVGTGGEIATLQILRQTASGSEVHGLAFAGPQIGVLVTGATGVGIAHVWIHDTGSRGLDVEDPYGPTSVAIRASLVESARELGVYVGGSEATIEATVVRDTEPLRDGRYGHGIHVQYDPESRTRSTVALRSSLVERNRDVGIGVVGSDAAIEATVVRGTQPRGDGTHGVGIAARHDDAAPQERAKVTLRASLVEQNRDFGVHVIGSEATIEATVVRDTQPSSDDMGGWGLAIVNGPASQGRTEVTLRASLLEYNHASSVGVIGSDVAIESTIVRATQPLIDGTGGVGIDVEIDPATEERATLALRASVLEDNSTFGIRVVGSDATIETTVVRDTHEDGDGRAGNGVAVDADGATRARSSLALRASLLERNREAGAFVMGSDATIESTVVRDTVPASDGTGGIGLWIQDDRITNERATLTLRASRIERNHDVGVLVSGSEATIESTVVRGTRQVREDAGGYGVSINNSPTTDRRSSVTLRSSLVEQNHDVGVVAFGSDVTIEGTVVRDTQPLDIGIGGYGIAIHESSTHERSTLTLRSSLVEQNQEVGVFVAGSDAAIDAAVVRATQPLGDGTNGRGITLQGGASASLLNSLVEQNHDVGVLVSGSEATIEATVVRDTQPRGDGTNGRGISIQADPDTFKRSHVTLRSSLVEHNHETGVLVLLSDASIESTVVRATRPNRDGTHGDGIAVESAGTPTTVAITSTTVASNTRAGIANFGATVVLVASSVQCNALDLNGRASLDGHPFSFDGSKENICGCDQPVSPCPVETAKLSPPEPASPSRPAP
ncbi:hypothetical protein BE08_38670, partial [Sorangium cellulosum]